MKQVFEQYAAYNVWANQRMIDTILSLPEETVKRTVESSFSSLYLTLLHMWNAESVWWQRLKLVETVQSAGNTHLSIQEISAGLMGQSSQWPAWIEKSPSGALEHEFIYRDSKRRQFKQPVYQMLLHLFNHGTYHRGQLVTMLRQLNITTIPATDFIVFTRGK
ncbi:DinB family protein [Segetibacter koreensis]|uniref:DinB family protein n=1 Tax=Segetibacter koreensis TaxID=398037 RepID=UPI00036AD800|nr:DinB family protein [Segetibacter koreensis]